MNKIVGRTQKIKLPMCVANFKKREIIAVVYYRSSQPTRDIVIGVALDLLQAFDIMNDYEHSSKVLSDLDKDNIKQHGFTEINNKDEIFSIKVIKTGTVL